MTGCPLLLDENLSESLLRLLLPEFPASQHVRLALRPGATDEEVWAHARTNQLALVTRDGDFQRLSVLRGAPPKVVWLQGHNLRNAEVVRVLRCNRAKIDAFVADAAVSLLVLRVDADGA